MEIKMSSLLNLLPLAMVATGAVFSYASLSASATENSEDIIELTESLEEVEDDISELQQQMTRSEIIQQNTAEDLSDVKADTKTILNLLQRQPTN
tara:strand:- start:589 stop:873 length:285 start_codon:yes stop_codon:yes gene_type:complete